MRLNRIYRAGAERKRRFYIECGASEELCDELLAIDRQAFRSFMRDVRRREDIDPECLAAKNPPTDYKGDEWMDDIGSDALFKAISALSEDETELLGEYAIEGYTQREIARSMKLTQGGVSRKLSRIFEKIRIALSYENGAAEGAEDADEEEANASAAGTNADGEDEKSDKEEKK